MPHKAGSLYAGSHTTCIDLTAKACDAIEGLPVVTSISLGIIDVMRGSSGSTKKVKVTFTDAGLRLLVKQGGAVQYVYVYTSHKQQGMEQVSRALRNAKISIHFV